MSLDSRAKDAIGFIGLGSMGLPMAVNLVRGGRTVRGFDVNKAAVEALAKEGGAAAANPADAARGCGLVLVVVASADQAESVLFGENGALATMAEDGVVVLHSTVPPAYSRGLGERLAAQGRHLLDAPISGGQVGAKAGELTVMASGDAAAFAAAEGALDIMARTVYRLGEEPGIGSTVKMINQHLAGVHIAAAAEAMALGTAAGADADALFEVISNSAGQSWMFNNRVPHILARDFSPRSAVEIFVKDLGIVLDTGRSIRFPLPIAASAHQQFLAAAAAGHGREDDSAVVRVYEQLKGVEVRGKDKG